MIIKRQNTEYSESLRLKVVKEVESGRFTAREAREHYGIQGHDTVNRWLRKYGAKKNRFDNHRSKEMSTDQEKIEQLEQKIKELESALSEAYLEGRVYKKLVSLGKDYYGIDLKKNFGMNASNHSDRKEK